MQEPTAADATDDTDNMHALDACNHHPEISQVTRGACICEDMQQSCIRAGTPAVCHEVMRANSTRMHAGCMHAGRGGHGACTHACEAVQPGTQALSGRYEMYSHMLGAFEHVGILPGGQREESKDEGGPSLRVVEDGRGEVERENVGEDPNVVNQNFRCASAVRTHR